MFLSICYKIIPDLKIVFNLSDNCPKGITPWHKELFFDILKMKNDDFYDLDQQFVSNNKLTILATYPDATSKKSQEVIY